jgi:regulator of replication initiation timing
LDGIFVNDEPLTFNNSDVVDRLARLRALLPLMATDLATARRRAAALAAENERLATRVRELESRLGEERLTRKPVAHRRRRVTHRAPR